MDTQNRCVPFVCEEVRRIGIAAHRNRIALLPRSATQIPVDEPFFFGLQVLHLQVEDAVVRDERLESLVVMTCQPIHAEAAKRCAYATQMVFVHIRLLAHLVNGSQIILHAQTAVVTRDFLVPFIAEARQSAAVGRYDDVIVRGHHHEVPTIAPELTNRRLRAAFAVEQSRIFLAWVEVRRIDNPGQHLLAVAGPHPAFLHLAHRQLVQDMFVLKRNLFGHQLIRRQVQQIQVVRLAHRVTFAQNQVALMSAKRVVVLSSADLLHKAFQIDCVDVLHSVPATRESQTAVVQPKELVHVRLECLAHKLRLSVSRGQVQHHQAVLVALVAVTRHALPCQLGAIWREGRVGVVAHHALGQVLRRARAYIIKVYVTIGGNGVFQTRFLATGVRNLLAVRRKSQLLHATERLHRTLVRLAFQDVHDVSNPLAVKVSQERMRRTLNPFVPMFVHQVGDDTSAGFRQVGILVHGLLYGLYLADKQQFTMVRREHEILDIFFVVGNLLEFVDLHRPVLADFHGPHLAGTALVAEIRNHIITQPVSLPLIMVVVGQLNSRAVGRIE